MIDNKEKKSIFGKIWICFWRRIWKLNTGYVNQRSRARRQSQKLPTNLKQTSLTNHRRETSPEETTKIRQNLSSKTPTPSLRASAGVLQGLRRGGRELWRGGETGHEEMPALREGVHKPGARGAYELSASGEVDWLLEEEGDEECERIWEVVVERGSEKVLRLIWEWQYGDYVDELNKA